MLVFEHRDVEWLAVFLIALMLRKKEREQAGTNRGGPINKRLAEESISSTKHASKEASHWQDTKLLKIVVKALGNVKIDLEREEFVGRKHWLRNLIANSYLKKTIDADYKALDLYLGDLQKILLKYVPTNLSKALMKEWMCSVGATGLAAIFEHNNPATAGVEYADTGVLNLRLEKERPEEAAVAAVSTNTTKAEDTGASFWDHFKNAKVTSYNTRAGVHSDITIGADISKNLGF